MQDTLLELLQPMVRRLASHLITRYPRFRGEYEDCIQEANTALLEAFPTLHSKQEPSAYLWKTAKLAMLHYCFYGRANLIPHYKGLVNMVSLDQPVFQQEDASVLAYLSTDCRCDLSGNEHASMVLKQAIDALPQKQQLVIRYHYGIDQAPESLNEISRRLSPQSPRPANAHYHHKRALSTLAQSLTPIR